MAPKRADYVVVVLERLRPVFAVLAGLAGLAVLAFAEPSMAEANVGLVYDVPSDCPSEAEFMAAVVARGGRFSGADAALSTRKIQVSIRRDPAGFVGSFQIEEDQGTSGARELHAPTCSEVMQGLSVVTAIALRQESDKTSQSPLRQESDKTSQSSLPVARVTSVPTPTPTPTPMPSSNDHRLRSMGQFKPESLSVPAGKLGFDWQTVGTLTAGVATGWAPSLLLPRYDLSLARANFVTTPDADSYLVGSIVRVRWTFLGPATYRSNDFSTSLAGFKAGISNCASLIYDTPGPAVLLCAEVAAGAMHLETKDAAGAITQSKTVGLGTAGLEVDSRYNFGAHFHLALRLGGELWVTKVAAERPDGSEVFHSSLFSGYAQLGVGVHF